MAKFSKVELSAIIARFGLGEKHLFCPPVDGSGRWRRVDFSVTPDGVTFSDGAPLNARRLLLQEISRKPANA